MNLEDYLHKNISNQKEITNTTSFYDKFNALSEMYRTEENKDNRKILRSQGKYNSKICMIFKDEQHFKDSMENLERIFAVYNIKAWDVLILYQNKFDDRDRNINILMKELLIVNPIVAYIFDDSELEQELLKRCPADMVFGIQCINVNNIQNLVEENLSSQIFDLFEFLITYNY